MSPISEETKRKLARCSTATLTTQLFKRGFRNVFVQGAQPLNPNRPAMVGEAFTLRNIPAREDLDQLSAFQDPEHPQRKAIEVIPPGHVLVIDCRGEKRVATAGGILITRLMVRGAAGLVTDGGIRDTAEVAKLDIPIYCAGPSAPTNLIRHHAIDMNLPIACGEVPVYPGDIVVGDSEGAVIIPRHLAEEVAEDGIEQERLERFVGREVAGGKPLPGTYPPNAETRARYDAWVKAGEKD